MNVLFCYTAADIDDYSAPVRISDSFSIV